MDLKKECELMGSNIFGLMFRVHELVREKRDFGTELPPNNLPIDCYAMILVELIREAHKDNFVMADVVAKAYELVAEERKPQYPFRPGSN